MQLELSSALARLSLQSTVTVEARKTLRTLRLPVAEMSGDDGNVWKGHAVGGRPGDTEGWIGRHGLNREVYIFSRLASAEIEDELGVQYVLAIFEATVNEWASFVQRASFARNWDVVDMLLRRTGAGFHWTRGAAGSQRGRWAATTTDPTIRDIRAASLFFSPGIASWTDGAARWFDSTSFRGAFGYRHPGDFLRNRWFREGWTWVGPKPGIDPYHLALLRKISRKDRQVNDDARNEELLRQIELGRNRQPRDIPPLPETSPSALSAGVVISAAALAALLLI